VITGLDPASQALSAPTEAVGHMDDRIKSIKSGHDGSWPDAGQ